MKGYLHIFPLALLALSLGCQGELSKEAPIHLNPNMDEQDRVAPQEGSAHFEDTRGMRPQVPGTVARGELGADRHLHTGKVGGALSREMPAAVKVDNKLLARGRERYDIYCTPCHGGAGKGDGIVIKRGLLPPPSFHDKRIRALSVGQLFDVITRGVRNMPSYAAQINALDRWAIVAYVRALQAGRSATVDQVPADIVDSKGWSKGK